MTTAEAQPQDEHGEHHGIAHVASKKVLLSTIAALLVLTILTVVANKAGLGLLVAMIIATVKAALVCMFFMHLWYDRKLHAVAFVSAVLFAVLFVGFALMDRGAYLDDVIWDVEAPPDNP